MPDQDCLICREHPELAWATCDIKSVKTSVVSPAMRMAVFNRIIAFLQMAFFRICLCHAKKACYFVSLLKT